MKINFRESKLFGKLNSWVLDHIHDEFISPNTENITDEERIEYIFASFEKHFPGYDYYYDTNNYGHETEALMRFIKRDPHCFNYPWTLYDFEVAMKEWGFGKTRRDINVEWYVPYLIAGSLYRMREALKTHKQPNRVMKLCYEYDNKMAYIKGGDNKYHALNYLFFLSEDRENAIILGKYHIEKFPDGYFALQKGEGEKNFFKSLVEAKNYAQNTFEQELKTFIENDLSFRWADEETFKGCYDKRYLCRIKPSYNFREGDYRWKPYEMYYEEGKFKLQYGYKRIEHSYDTYSELKEAAEAYFKNDLISSLKD